MPDDSSELLMKFELPNGFCIAGESLTDLSETQSEMAEGFQKNQTLEIESFSLRLGIGGDDAATMRSESERKQREDEENRRIQRQNDLKLDDWEKAKKINPDTPRPTLEKLSTKASSIGQFQKFREGKFARYPVDMQPVQITRGIDKASIILLNKCIARTQFNSATLIKRKAAGTAAAGEIFLRYDFETVMITKIDWDEDDPIKEKISFICRAVTIHYKPQLPDGSLTAAVQGFWSMSRDAKPHKLKGS